MSDLISRSEVLRLLYKIFDKYDISTDKHASVGKSFGIDVFKEIKEMPTAYSVDKIIEELETLKEEKEIGSHKVMIKEAIEIVKQGGISDDTDNVCEWKKYPFNWFAGCDGRKVEYKQGDYCPYCGKKIKVKQNDN